MAKAVGLVFALCFLAVATIAAATRGHEKVFNVDGEVYCDPCRVKFVTELSESVPGATVRLECRNIETKAVTYSVEDKTDQHGHYVLQVIGDHENDICEVSVAKSTREDCNEPMGEFEKSRIVCTDNSGMPAADRYANPIGFMTKGVLPQCGPVLFNMGVFPDQSK